THTHKHKHTHTARTHTTRTNTTHQHTHKHTHTQPHPHTHTHTHTHNTHNTHTHIQCTQKELCWRMSMWTLSIVPFESLSLSLSCRMKRGGEHEKHVIKWCKASYVL